MPSDAPVTTGGRGGRREEGRERGKEEGKEGGREGGTEGGNGGGGGVRERGEGRKWRGRDWRTGRS
jgi:hypothetical protein